MREIIVDNFAGGGGASTGIELATGRSVDIAINHDPAAIAMHQINHPETVHYTESVWDINPVDVCAGRPVGLAWFSPDCTHFSKAKGAKPVKKEIRGLAWVVLRWAATVRPRVIMLENVEEFKTWGPLKADDQGRLYPDKSKVGKTFDSFIRQLRGLGYEVEHKELIAYHYGAPTSRKRFFLVARCDGRPIVWPEMTHDNPKSLAVQSGQRLPWRTAAECIDWSIPCPSIFATSEEIKDQYGIRAIRPLAEATMRRIMKGIQKFVIDNPEPYIVKSAAPFLIQYHSEQSGKEVRGQGVHAPIMTLDTAPRYGLVTSNLVVLRNNMDGKPIDKPLPTITTSQGHFAEVRSFLVKYYGSEEHGQAIDRPIGTITSKDRFGLVTVRGEQYMIADIGMRMLTPRELYDLQGFPHDYVIDFESNGKAYSKKDQIARCGNSVPPPFAKALVEANLPEMCSRKQEAV